MQVDIKKDKNLVTLNNLGQTGLVNLGNTCFINTAIQCFSSIKHFVAYFLSDQYLQDINKSKESDFVKCFSDILKLMWSENCIVRPVKFKKKLSEFYEEYSGTDEDDSSECFLKIITLLHEGLNYKVNIISLNSDDPKTYMEKVNKEAFQSWKNYFENSYSIPVKLFYGQFWERRKCISCGIIKSTFSPFGGMIYLPVKKNTNTLSDCIKEYTTSEDRIGDNQIYCEKCKKNTDAKSKISVWRLPSVLTLAFQRFDNHRKLTNYINFSVNKVNFFELTEREKHKNVFYDLVAIANHRGSIIGGHYWAFCRGTNGKWYEYNDDSVTEIPDTSSLVTNKAYYLVYVRRDIKSDIVISS